MLKAIVRRLGLCAILMLAIASVAAAQQGQRQKIPHDLQLTIMIKATLIAYNHANMTGNYTVLRDLGAPSFRQANTPAKLAEIFSRERHRDVDISAVILLKPQLTQKPAIDGNGRLILKGFFPSQPERVNFTLGYEVVNGVWRLFAIGVKTHVVAATQKPAPEAPKKKPVDNKAATKATKE